MWYFLTLNEIFLFRLKCGIDKGKQFATLLSVSHINNLRYKQRTNIFNRILFKRSMLYMLMWKCITSTNTTNHVWAKRYRIYISDFFQIIDTANVNIFAYSRSIACYSYMILRCGTVYRDCVVNSTRNIAKSTNDIHVCEKNNSGFVSLPICYAYARWKCKFGKNVCTYICGYVHVRRGYIRQTNDTVQNTICSDSQSIENSRR